MSVIAPNTTNQIKIQDQDGDVVFFDVFTDDVDFVIVTTKTRCGYAAVSMTADDLRAVLRHLVAQGALTPSDLEVL